MVMQRTKINKRRKLLISCFPAEKMRKGWRITQALSDYPVR